MLTLSWLAAAADLPGEALPVREWDLQHLQLDVTLLHEERAVEGQAELRLARLAPTSRTVRLHQVGLDLRQVTVNGEVATYSTTADQLLIQVPPTLSDAVVQVSWRAQPRTGLHFRGGRGSVDGYPEVWSQGEDEDHRHWFPSWDYPNDTFTTEVAVTAPAGWRAVANGTLVERSPAPGGERWSYRLDQPIVNYLVAVAAAPYAVYTLPGPLPLEVLAAPDSTEADVQATFRETEAQLAFFSELLGQPYPYPNYRQVLVQRFLYGGMENATTTVLADRLLRTDSVRPRYHADEVIAHELAHHWFGDLLTCYGWRDLWLNEGFATYYAWRWQETTEGPEWAAGDLLANRESALYENHPMAPRGWTPHDRDYAAQYVRGMSVLHALEVLLGREVFDEAIRDWVRGHAFSLVETDQLRRTLEDRSGQPLGWMFDRWVHGTEFPTVLSSWQVADGRLTISLRPGPDSPRPVLPIDLEIGLPEGPITRRVWMDGGEVRFELELPSAPRWVAVDSTALGLAHFRPEQTDAAWLAQLEQSASPTARWRALRALKPSPEAVPLLARMAERADHHPTYRAEVVATLGRFGGPEATAALLQLSFSNFPQEFPPARARLEALAKVEPTPEVRDVLRRSIRQDPPWLAAVALEGLATQDGEGAASLARAALGGRDPSADQALHRAAAGVLGRHGKVGDLGLLLAAFDRGDTRDAAARAATRIAAVSEAEADDLRVARALEAWLDDPDLRTRQLAVSLLGEVGDEASVAALQQVRVRDRYLPDLVEASFAATRLIRQGAPSPAAPGPTRDELQERLQALEERLKRLETWR